MVDVKQAVESSLACGKPAVIDAPASSSVPQRPCQKGRRHMTSIAATRTTIHVAVIGVSAPTGTASTSKRYGRIGVIADVRT